MTKEEIRAILKMDNIKVTKVDNGYGVKPSYNYTCERYSSKPRTITLDQDNHYGIKVFMLSINDTPITNVWGKTLYWETKEDAVSDIIAMFNNQMPSRSYTMVI